MKYHHHYQYKVLKLAIDKQFVYTAVSRQNALTLIWGIVEKSDFSDMAYNSAYVSDVQATLVTWLITLPTLVMYGD